MNFKVDDIVFVKDCFNSEFIIHSCEKKHDKLKLNTKYHIKEIKKNNDNLNIILYEFPHSSFLSNRFVTMADYYSQNYNL